MNKEIRVNDRIRAREVRLVGNEGEQLGVVSSREALDIARSRNLDLIEIAPTATPPVCKLMDYGKFKYEQGRRDREAHKKQKNTEIKGIRLRPGTDDHDLDVKLKHLRDFLEDGNKVKVTVIFRSREMSHPEFARRSLEYLAEKAADISVSEKAPAFEGRTMTMILGPKAPEKAEKKKPTESAHNAESHTETVEASKEPAAVAAPADNGKPRVPGEVSKKKKEFVLDPTQI